eukprot:GHVU01065842.1.p1 GENE.GHVU01065842.1~~GHVU01065842.1.p1  ORF type:complete len:149 (+),score=14.47 GHVU01065842.1:31-447(+)
MAEAALRDDAGTPEERAHRIVGAAVLMGQAARTAEETGELIRNFLSSGHYRGEVRNGVQHGLGVHRNSDRSVDYEGEWRNGKWHGLGVDWYRNRTTLYTGQWQHSRFHGLGVMRNPDGSVRHAGWWNQDSRSETAPPE